MIYFNITKYVQAKTQYNTISSRIQRNKVEYFIDGEWTVNKPDEPEFSRRNPNNPNRRKIII